MPASVTPPGPPAGVTGRAYGILRFPRQTLASVIARPTWIPLLVLVFAVTAITRIGLMTTRVGQQALTDQWVQRIEAFGGEVDDGLYRTLQTVGERGWQMAGATSVLSGILLPFALAAGLHGLFGRGSGRTYRQALAVAVSAGVVLALRDLIAAPVNYMREALASPLSVGSFFRMLDESSGAARLLSMIDVFVLWWVVVVAIGTALLYRRSIRSTAATFLGIYGGCAVVLAAVMVLSGSGE